jgi:hypothetical protein
MTAYTPFYHADADILELFFKRELSTAVVYLTPDMILHFRLEDNAPISLIINNYSHLARYDEYGPQAFRLEVERWPKAWQNAVRQILTQPPLSEWLTISSYHPPQGQPVLLAVVQPILVPAM